MKFYTDRLIMTPGPTEIPLRVKKAMIREAVNPDLDPSFLELYNNVRGKLRKLLNAERSSIYVMVGEAIMGLEAAVVNTMKPGDKVIVVANGVFGEGFADIVRAYGGEPLLVAGDDWRKGVDVGEVERALERNKDASILTVVHCDTPSAILNDVMGVAKLARDFGVITIVDAVSTIGGVPVEFDNWGLDVLIGGSQKVLNAPPGLTVIALSDGTWERVERVNYTGLYTNFKLWRDMLDVKGVFPYTMSDILVYALDEALNIILEEGLELVYSRHVKAREASWRAIEALNLEPYPSSLEHSSPTVSAMIVPQRVSERRLKDYIWAKYGVMLAGSWGRLEGKVIRVGHMGLQASRTHLLTAYTALARGLKDMGLEVSVSRVVDAIEDVYT